MNGGMNYSIGSCLVCQGSTGKKTQKKNKRQGMEWKGSSEDYYTNKLGCDRLCCGWRAALCQQEDLHLACTISTLLLLYSIETGVKHILDCVACMEILVICAHSQPGACVGKSVKFKCPVPVGWACPQCVQTSQTFLGLCGHGPWRLAGMAKHGRSCILFNGPVENVWIFILWLDRGNVLSLVRLFVALHCLNL